MVHGDELREQLTDEALVKDIVSDFRTAAIDEATKAMLEFVVKVTEASHSVTRSDIEHLRRFGFSDEALFSMVEVAGFFGYANRIASALGIELDDFLEQRENGESEQ